MKKNLKLKRQGAPKFVLCDNYRAFERINKLYLMINETILIFIRVDKNISMYPAAYI